MLDDSVSGTTVLDELREVTQKAIEVVLKEEAFVMASEHLKKVFVEIVKVVSTDLIR